MACLTRGVLHASTAVAMTFHGGRGTNAKQTQDAPRTAAKATRGWGGVMVARSYLFVPGDRPERFAKAMASGADAVVIDLEDAVAPAAKDAARNSLQERLARAGADNPPKTVVVRVNASDTVWFEEDLRACAASAVSAIMVPKAERAEDLSRIAASHGKPLIALVETAAGFDNLRAVAFAAGVQRLAFGSIDFQLDTGISGDGEELLLFRSQMVLMSRVAGLARPVDGVSTSISDAQMVLDEAQRARRLGFGGKLCIHPVQVDAVNRSFSPSPAEIVWAQRMLAAAKSANGSAFAVDGKMVDKPVILRAEAIVRQVDGTR
jgi:citrate lyase subunit beta/citryl-CoA lyase